MTIINLSGIQALKPPLALFDEFFEKKTHFANAKYPEGTDVTVDVSWEKDNPYDTQEEPAIVVKLDKCRIGYIPCVSTIDRYIQDAERDNDLKGYRKHKARRAIVVFLRNCLAQDIFRNHMDVQGVLTNVMVGGSGEVLSISIGLDYI